MYEYELIVDNFAGGGGASTGIEQAIGRCIDIAINHDKDAILMHKTNHPNTKHYCESVWDVDPKEVTKGKPVGMVWLSPDCKHFSKALGRTPVDRFIRGLAWVALRWAKQVRPRVIMLENVEEFTTWGPLVKDESGNYYPDSNRKGETFHQFINALKKLGYEVEYRELRACDYGAPTIRKRLFLIARCDGKKIVWPEPTHAKADTLEVMMGIKKPWRTAAEIIDFSKPCPSIFGRKKPLVQNTMNRIAKGIKKYVIDNPNPYIVEDCLPLLISYHSETKESEVRGISIDSPLHTIDTSNRFALVCAFITKHFGGGYEGSGSDVNSPLHTITCKDHNSLVVSHLIQFNNNCDGQKLTEPLRTIVAGAGHLGEVRTFLTKCCQMDIEKNALPIIQVKGQDYIVVDIGMRFLDPTELFPAQGFPEDYIIDRDYTGKKYPKTKQIARCGNSVCPPLAKALTEANLSELCQKTLAAV